MVTIGNISQFAAFFLAMAATVFILIGVMRNDARFIESGRRSIYGLALFTTTASIAMTYLFAIDNFQVEYVASYSDRALPFYYKLTSFWAGQKGSLLLWAWLLSIFSSIVAFNTRNELSSRTTPYIYLVLSGTLTFFLFLLSTLSNPFDLLNFIPSDGKGLNPMLQNPGMLFHPPTLFLGYIGFTIPFAYAIAAMVTGKLDASWLRKTRIWTLISWIFLTIGIILGCQWAYVELGWGGFWAWDPVENASFIPWLVATAYLHTAIIQEKRNMMKVWNMVLILLTFILCIFGTYLVRSGILQSVHDFGATGLGGFFIFFLVTVFLGSLYLIFESYRELRSESAIESFISRESTFLYNNVIFLSITFSTLLGTVFPLLSEAVTGKKITVGQPFFNQVNTPLFLLLLLITGICPLIGWRKASADNLRKNFLVPFLSASIGAMLLFIAGVREFYPLTSFSLSIFVAVTIFNEFRVGTLARKRLTGESVLTAFPRLLWRMRSRYGGYIVHLGIVILIVGITGSSAYKLEKQATLNKGESMKIGAYELRYDDFRGYRDRNREVYTADLAVLKDGSPAGTISPERRYYINAEQPTTEVSLRMTLMEDLYVTMPGIGKNEVITLKVTVNPLLVWMWIGAAIMVLGGIVAAIPVRRKKEVSNAA
jgi:cytochrome c-type biogenesis protein CcmF